MFFGGTCEALLFGLLVTPGCFYALRVAFNGEKCVRDVL